MWEWSGVEWCGVVLWWDGCVPDGWCAERVGGWRGWSLIGTGRRSVGGREGGLGVGMGMGVGVGVAGGDS